MDDLTIERSFDKQTALAIDVLGLLLLTCYPWIFFRIRHWQTPGRMVQELIVCTVLSFCSINERITSATYQGVPDKIYHRFVIFCSKMNINVSHYFPKITISKIHN